MLYNPNVSAFGETNQQNFYNYDSNAIHITG